MNSSSQIEAFISALPEAARTPRATGPNEPQAVFQTALQLDRRQEQRLVQHCMARMSSLEIELGKQWVNQPDWYRNLESTDNQEHESVRTFFGSRALWDLIYSMRLEWRQWIYGGIWASSNIHLPLTHRYIRQMVARASNYFFGTSPWFGISPAGNDDFERAKIFDRWAKWGFDQAKVSQVLEQAIEFSFVRGECIIKTSFANRSDYFQTFAEVAIGPDGTPYAANDGDYIHANDPWMMDEMGNWVLVRDGETGLPEGFTDPEELEFDVRLVEKVATEYRGLDVAIPHYQDVLVSKYARSLEEADFVVHRYDKTAIELAAQYIEHLRATGQGDDLPRVIDLLRAQSAGRTDSDRAAQEQPRPDLGEGAWTGSGPGVGHDDWHSGNGYEPVVRVAECYLRFDALERGQLSNIVALVDVSNQRLILADYVRNYTPDGKRPFHVVRPQAVDNRWHGISLCEAIWRLNGAIDLQLNRINESNKRSGHFIAWDPSAFYESEGMQHPTNLDLNAGQTYTLKPGKILDQAFISRPIVEVKQDRLMGVIELLMQVQQTMTGVASANDADMAGLEQTKLATGIRHLEKANQELFAPFLTHLSVGIESVVRAGIELMMANVSERETIRWMDGDAPATEVIHGQDIRDFKYDLKLELSRYRAEQQSMQNMEAITLLEHYGAQLPEVRMAIRQLVERQLALYEIHGKEAMLDLLDQMMPMLPAGAPPTPAGAAVTSPEKKVSAEV